MCIFGVYIEGSLREFLKVHIVQGRESFKKIINSN